MQQRIIQGANELFSQYGIKSVTMDDIARHLSISKKTIYTVFEDKNDLVRQLMRQTFEGHMKMIDEGCANADNAVEEILEVMSCVKKIMGAMNPSLFYDMQKYHTDAWLLFKEFRNGYIQEKVKNNLKKGIEEGNYRNDINIDILAKLRIEQVDMAFNPFIFPSDKFNIPQVILELTRHYLYGIATLKGHRLINKYLGFADEN